MTSSSLLPSATSSRTRSSCARAIEEGESEIATPWHTAQRSPLASAWTRASCSAGSGSPARRWGAYWPNVSPVMRCRVMRAACMEVRKGRRRSASGELIHAMDEIHLTDGAHVLVHDRPVRGDEVGLGDAGGAEVHGDLAALIKEVGEGGAVAREPGPGVGLGVLEYHAHELHPVTHAARAPLEDGMLDRAGAAPAGPEVHHHRAPAEGLEGHGPLAVDEIGRAAG